jgi:hypothetical protein
MVLYETALLESGFDLDDNRWGEGGQQQPGRRQWLISRAAPRFLVASCRAPRLTWACRRLPPQGLLAARVPDPGGQPQDRRNGGALASGASRGCRRR